MNRHEVSRELRIFEDMIIDKITDKKAIEQLKESFEKNEAIISFVYNFKDYTITIKEN